METGEIPQQEQGWQAILPEQELPEGVDTWMIGKLDLGKFFLTLEQNPEANQTGDEAKDVFVLAPDIQGATSKEALSQQGFRTINVVLTPSNDSNRQVAELRFKGTDLRFEAVLQRYSNDHPLRALTRWVDVHDDNANATRRDLMIKRDQLKDIEIRFPKEEKIKLSENPDWEKSEHALMARNMVAEQLAGGDKYFDIPTPHLAAREIVYDLELLTKGSNISEFMDKYGGIIPERTRREAHENGVWHRLRALQAAMKGDYSFVKAYYLAAAGEFALHARNSMNSNAQYTSSSLGLKDLSEELPDTFEPFTIPQSSWEDPIVMEANKRRIEEGGDLL